MGQADRDIAGNYRCEMPDCVGSLDDETVACRDPSGELIEMCESCLDDGWRSVVDVLEGSA